MKFQTPVLIGMLSMKISKPELLVENKMSAAAILAELAKDYNSAIYETISTKFETQLLIGKPSMKISKPEALCKNQMAT